MTHRVVRDLRQLAKDPNNKIDDKLVALVEKRLSQSPPAAVQQKLKGDRALKYVAALSLLIMVSMWLHLS